MGKFILKLTILAIILLAVMVRIEMIDAWNTPANNEQYTYARWNSLYELTEKHQIDVMLMGNSRIYNGINPNLLSTSTSSLCFEIGAPGTTLHDTYYSFKEILKRTTPKVLIIETSCINAHENNENNVLITYFKSFNARKDIVSKALSTPFLFHINHWPYAWVNSIRNHNYLFDEEQDLKKNIAEYPKIKELITRGKDNMYMGKYSLYLGKFNGNNGLKKDILDRYEKEGPPADGAKMVISELHKDYVKKLDQLCREHGVELVFLTVPVYYKHIKNYDQFRAKMAELINPLGRKWLDLQQTYDPNYFLPEHFDNTYEENQHTTAAGSFACTRKLADFLKTELPGVIPNRSSEKEWNDLFYGTEEYFVNHPIRDGDKKNKVLFKDLMWNGAKIQECGYAGITDKYGVIWAKVERTESLPQDFNSKTLRMIVADDKNTNLAIDLRSQPYYSDKNHLVFSTNVKPINITKVLQMQFL